MIKAIRINFCFLKLILIAFHGRVWDRVWVPISLSIIMNERMNLMWTIIIISENGKKQVLETISDDTEAVLRYKTLVENRHTPGGFGYTPIYLSWIEF